MLVFYVAVDRAWMRVGVVHASRGHDAIYVTVVIAVIRRVIIVLDPAITRLTITLSLWHQ